MKSNIFSLLKYDFINSYNLNSLFNKKDKKSFLKLIGVLLLCIYLGALVSIYTMAIAKALKETSMLELLLAQGLLISFGIIGFTTIFKMAGILFKSHDYNMLSAMPINPFKIILVKIINITIPTYIILGICIVPSLYAYYTYSNSGIVFILYSIILFFFIPLIPIALATLFGAVIMYFSSRMKLKNLFTIIFFLLCTGILIILPRFFTENFDKIIAKANNIIEVIYSVYPLSKFYIDALVNGSLIGLLAFCGISLLIFLGFLFIVNTIYTKINARLLESSMKNNYVLGELKESSVLKTLVLNELKKYVGIPMVLLNTCIGAVIYIGIGIASLFEGEKLLEGIIGISIPNTLKIGVVILIGAFCCVTTNTTGSSISLEGNKLWLIKVLPMDTMEFFKSKIIMNLIFIVPSVIVGTILIGVGLKLSFFETIIGIVGILIIGILNTMTGLLVNLKFPNLIWTSEVVVVKRSVSTMIMVLLGVATIFLVGYLYIILKISMFTYIGIILILALALIGVEIYILKKWGVNRVLSL